MESNLIIPVTLRNQDLSVIRNRYAYPRLDCFSISDSNDNSVKCCPNSIYSIYFKKTTNFYKKTQFVMLY